MSAERLTKIDAMLYAQALRTREKYYCALNGYGADAEHPVEQLPMDGLKRLAEAADVSIVRGVDSVGIHYKAVIDGVEFIAFEIESDAKGGAE